LIIKTWVLLCFSGRESTAVKDLSDLFDAVGVDYSGEKGGHGKKVGRIRKACVFAVQAGIHQQPKPSNISTNI
jgi:hypothetical protein